jgi:hypothetical protein
MAEQCSSQSFPAVETAYPLAVSAYDVALKRFDAIDGKLNTLITFAVTVSLAVPVLANAKGLSFRSGWLVVAVSAFVFGVGVATFARLNGKLNLLDPKVMYDSYLDLDEWNFKRHTIYWAGENFRHNQSLINRNGNLAAVSASLFALEAVAVGAWVLAASL